ncbi:helix-turn-helix transcriptional regulator [uncultured Psychromonas sp.]|uniref:helix-turn-helix domain-containing protein n=1 Tax=uncultured Psychromonas sp. TaxID=173974 RepID=UPI002608A552|nr:helix-turn-helix transcriptional regulator [uncultured Psychromonas sp.]
MSNKRTNVFAGISNSTSYNLIQFGNNLNIAIKRRGLRQKDIADAALISVPTLRKALKGDPTVSIGVYVAILSQLQLVDQLAELASPELDEIGIALAERSLPTRVRIKKSKYDF